MTDRLPFGMKLTLAGQLSGSAWRAELHIHPVSGKQTDGLNCDHLRPTRTWSNTTKQGTGPYSIPVRVFLVQ